MIEPPEDRRLPADPAAGAAGGGRRQRRAGAVRDHVLPAVVPAGAVGQPVPGPGARSTACAHDRRAGAPRPDRRPQRQRAGRLQARESRCRSRRPSCRWRCADDAVAHRRAATRSSTTGWPTCWGCRPSASGARSTATASQRLSPIGCAVAQGYAQLPYQDVTIKTDVSKDVQYYLAERQAAVPRRQRRADLAAPLPAATRWPRSCSGRSGGSRRRRSTRRATAASRRTRSSASRGWSGTTTATCAASTAPSGSRSTRSGTSRANVGENAAAAGPLAEAVARHVSLQQAGQEALQQAINDNPPAPAGAFVAMDPDNGEVYAMGSLPTFNPNIFAKPASGVDLQVAQQRRRATTR